ncbi:hypothetical protein CRYUN_Cryun21dG0097600 [Craigia yunnanensis]
MIVATKFGSNVYRLRIPWRPFSNDATAKLSSSNTGNLEKESEGQQYDIEIVGGGMVGLALACSLASRPLTKHLKIAIIEIEIQLWGENTSLRKKTSLIPGSVLLHLRLFLSSKVINIMSQPVLILMFCFSEHFSELNECYNVPRLFVMFILLSIIVVAYVADIGAWRYVEQRHAYFDKMQVWDYTGLGYAKYNARNANKEVLWYVVENKVLLSSLLSHMQDTDLQRKLYSSRVTSMSILPNSSSVEVDSTLSVTSFFTHGRLGKLELEDDNSLYAKLVVIEIELVRFLPAGPIALLPIGDKFNNIVWTMNPKDSSEFKSMSEDDFLKAVNYALDYGCGPHPTSSLLGNADIFGSKEIPPAHTVHPLAGQGVNLGFGDASTLSSVISEGIALGTDIGEVSLLKKYEEDRKPANIMMMAVLDGFQKHTLLILVL